MLRRAAISVASLVFAFGVLGTSIFRTTLPHYAFSQAAIEGGDVQSFVAGVDYYLPYPGILPDHFLWPIKAFRDKAWLFLTRDSAKRAELLLLFADKRIGMAEALIKGGKAELGVTTASKGEQYLQQAYDEQCKAADSGADTASFLNKLARASLKHREVMESLMLLAPEDARPVLNEALDYPKQVYEKAVHSLNEQGRPIPIPESQEVQEDEGGNENVQQKQEEM